MSETEVMKALLAASEAYSASLRASLDRVQGVTKAGVEADILNDVLRGMSLREAASVHHVGVGRVRGIVQRHSTEASL